MSKILPEGKAYACPKCGQPMNPHDSPWDVLHCLPCNSSVDLWYDPKPIIIDASTPVPVGIIYTEVKINEE